MGALISIDPGASKTDAPDGRHTWTYTGYQLRTPDMQQWTLEGYVDVVDGYAVIDQIIDQLPGDYHERDNHVFFEGLSWDGSKLHLEMGS